MNIKYLNLLGLISFLLFVGIFVGIGIGIWEGKNIYKENYWDQLTLTNYIIKNHKIIDFQNIEGNGMVGYTINDIDYIIQCHNVIKGSHYKNCCKEGSVTWNIRYASNGYTWNNISYNNCIE